MKVNVTYTPDYEAWKRLGYSYEDSNEDNENFEYWLSNGYTTIRFAIRYKNDTVAMRKEKLTYDNLGDETEVSFTDEESEKGIDVKYLFKDYKNKVSNYNSNYYFIVEGIELSTDQFKQIVNYMVFKSYMVMRRIELRSSEDRFIGSSDFNKSIWDI